LAALGLVATVTAAAPTASRRYGDWLLASIADRHAGVIAIRIDANGTSGPIWFEHGRIVSTAGTILPLADAMGHPIGTVSLATRAGESGTASEIAAELGRRIYTAEGLSDPDPFVADTRRSLRAQALVDRMIDAHPDIVTLALHVASVEGGANRIIASNFGRIGKLADKDDLHVISDDATLAEVTNGGARLAVELPLHDRAGHVIGALSTSFKVQSGDAPKQTKSKAIALRDEIAAAIPSITWCKE